MVVSYGTLVLRLTDGIRSLLSNKKHLSQRKEGVYKVFKTQKHIKSRLDSNLDLLLPSCVTLNNILKFSEAVKKCMILISYSYAANCLMY